MPGSRALFPPTRPDAVAPRQPTPYRYALLVQRARELTQTATQIESALLPAIEKEEAENYNLLRATQDVRITEESIRLRSLRADEAVAGVQLARLQGDRAEIRFNHYNKLLGDGLLFEENAAMWLGAASSAISGASAGAAQVPSAPRPEA